MENTTPDTLMRDIVFKVLAYSEDETLLGVEPGYIDYLLPGQILGVANFVILPGNTKVVRIDIEWEHPRSIKTVELLAI